MIVSVPRRTRPHEEVQEKVRHALDRVHIRSSFLPFSFFSLPFFFILLFNHLLAGVMEFELPDLLVGTLDSLMVLLLYLLLTVLPLFSLLLSSYLLSLSSFLSFVHRT